MSQTFRLRKLGPDPNSRDVDDAAQALVDAFREDFFTANMLGGSKDPALAHQLQRVQVAAGVVDGEVYVAEIGEENETVAKIIAAAVWFPPGKVMIGSEAQREAGANEFFANLDPNLSKWWMEVFFPTFDQLSISAYGEGVKLASWHLLQLGVRPAYQRIGIAKALINMVEEKARAAGEKLCLEAETETNLKIYERLGFRLKGETRVQGLVGESPVYALLLDEAA